MYEKILVPLDGSKVGEAALPDVEDLVLKLAPGIVAEVIFLQVISELTYDFLTTNEAAQLPYSETDLVKIKEGAQSYLEKTAESLKSKGIQVRTIVAEGNAAEEIIRVARENDVSLIAMSTHGRSGIGRWALGSITDKVLRESKVPVLTVRANPGK